jgi:hypothetical protein
MLRSIKNFFTSLQSLFHHFFKHDIVKAIVLILLCLLTALFFYLIDELGIITNPRLISICHKIADIIIASGFFAVILKGLRLSNFFKEDLADVIYDKKFLTQTTEEFKEKAWKNVTECLYESKFPELGVKINERIYREIIPDDLDRHHKDVKSYYTIRKIDNDHILISHVDSYTIISKEKKTRLKAEYVIDKLNDSSDLTNLIISSYTANNIELVNSLKVGSWEHIRNENRVERKVKLDEEIDVPTNGELLVEIKAESVLNKNLSLSWRKNFKLFTEGAEIFIDGDTKNLIIDFQPFGNSRKYNETGQPIGKNFKKNMEILFPGDGYIIFVTIK